MTFADGVLRGTYEGNLVFTNTEQPGRFITLPFGAYFGFEPLLSLTHNDKPIAGTTHNFGEVLKGYTESERPPALTVTATNAGTRASGARRIILSGPNAGSFELSQNSLTSIQTPGNNRVFTVRPRANLPAGVHTATVTIINTDASPIDIPQSFNVSFTVSTWADLRTAINDAPANTPTTIHISNNFSAPNNTAGNTIVIPADRDITLVSTNTSDDAANVRVLTQARSDQRHFTVYGSLALGQNITLRGGSGSNSGGVILHTDGTLTMYAGSVIENCHRRGSGGAVRLRDTGTTFRMYGGTIRNNIAPSGGGVSVEADARMIMSGGLIYGNSSTNTTLGSGGGGVHVTSTSADAFTMTGGSIMNNSAVRDGGGIFTAQSSTALTVPATAYGNLNIGADAVFYDNTAGNGASAPPDNRLPHIASASVSIWDYALNNYDINYTGRLGQMPAQ